MGKGFEFRVYTGQDQEYQERLRNPSKEPHRCDDRIEDLCRVIVQWGSLQQLQEAWRPLWTCLNSEEGKEPRVPYVMLTADDPLYKEPQPQSKPEMQEQRQHRAQDAGAGTQPPAPSHTLQQQQQQGQVLEQQEHKSWWRR